MQAIPGQVPRPRPQVHEKDGFDREKDAETYLAGIVVATDRGDYRGPASAKATIGGQGDIWVANQSYPEALAPKELRVDIAGPHQARVGQSAPGQDPALGGGGLAHEVRSERRQDPFGQRQHPRPRVLAGILDIAVVLDRFIASNPPAG